MKCSEATELISRKIDNDLNAEEEKALNEHIAECQNCRKEMEDIYKIVKSMKDIDVPKLPSGYHAELMEKIEAEKVVPFTGTKTNKINFKKYASIAAAFLVVAVVGLSRGGYLFSSGSSESSSSIFNNVTESSGNEASEDSVQAATAEAATSGSGDEGLSIASNAVGNGEIKQNANTNNITDEKTTFDETGETTASSSEERGDGIATAQGNGGQVDARIMSENPVISSETTGFAQMILQCENKDETQNEILSYISENGGTGEITAEGHIYAAMPEEGFEAFMEYMENLGTINKNTAENGKYYTAVDIELTEN